MRGGARPGAGAKPKADARHSTISFRVSRETRYKMQRLQEEGYDIRQMIEDTVDLCYDDLIGQSDEA